jgi:hypothetical protein
MSYVPEVLEIIPNPSIGYNNWASSSNFYENIDATTNGTPTQATGVFALGDKSGNKYGLGLSHGVKYESGIWYDNGSNEPYSLSNTSSYSSSLLVADAEYIYIWYNSGDCLGRFLSPYWEPIPTVSTSSTMVCLLTYNDATNTMHYYISETEPSTQFFGNRELFYRIRNATVVNGSTNININHYYGTHTTDDFNPTVYGVYHLERVLTNPLEVHSGAYASVTQNAVDAWNATQAAAAAAAAAAQAVIDAAAAAAAAAAQAAADALAAEAAAQAAADAAAVQAAADAAAAAQAALDAAALAYANTPRGRRGNHNFW